MTFNVHNRMTHTGNILGVRYLWVTFVALVTKYVTALTELSAVFRHSCYPWAAVLLAVVMCSLGSRDPRLWCMRGLEIGHCKFHRSCCFDWKFYLNCNSCNACFRWRRVVMASWMSTLRGQSLAVLSFAHRSKSTPFHPQGRHHN